MLHLYAALAEKERRLIGDRTRAALQAKKAAGAALGNRTNLGKVGSAGRVSQAQAADQFAKNVLPVLDAVRTAGASSLGEVADALNARGIRSATGGAWYRSTVRNLLARAKSAKLELL